MKRPDVFPPDEPIKHAQVKHAFPFLAVGSENPPLTVIRKFVHLLDQSDLDFQEELEVARLREEVVTKIRGNQQLEKDLNLMDIKIGLLVKNRITLEVSGVCGTFASPRRGGAGVFAHNTFDPAKLLQSPEGVVQSLFTIFMTTSWCSVLPNSVPPFGNIC